MQRANGMVEPADLSVFLLLAGERNYMGLDMYLTKRTYVKNWDFMLPEELHKITVTKNGESVEHIQSERISHVIEEMGYWRKANAIHNWFVENVQDGVDECQLSYVPREKLKELLGLVKEILADHSKSEKLLPTTSGFFFGSTEYDEYYFEDLDLTKEIIETALKDYDGDFYYQSSW